MAVHALPVGLDGDDEDAETDADGLPEERDAEGEALLADGEADGLPEERDADGLTVVPPLVV